MLISYSISPCCRYENIQSWRSSCKSEPDSMNNIVWRKKKFCTLDRRFFYPAFFEGLDMGYFDHFLKQGKKEKYSILWSLLRQFHIWFRNYSCNKLNDERGVFASVLNLFLWLFSSLLHQSIMYMTGTRIRYVIQLSIKYKAPNCYNSV